MNDCIRIVIDQRSFSEALGLRHQNGAGNSISINVPITLRRRGVETKLVVETPGQSIAEPDQTMIQAIVNGRQPPDLTTWDALDRIDLPFDWQAQKRCQRLA